MKNYTTHFINLCLIFFLSACAGSIETRGYFPEDSKIKYLKANKTTKNQVIDSIGYPSTVSAFNPNTWIYLETKFEKSAFFDPEEVESKVLEISFSDDNKIENISNYVIKDGSENEFSDKTTPTYGHSINAVQQMIGNIGKFNKPQ